MARVLFFLALIIAAASAFVAPASNAGEFYFGTDYRFGLVARQQDIDMDKDDVSGLESNLLHMDFF